MDFAEAYTVFEKNERARCICLLNIGVIHFKNQEYQKAVSLFGDAAKYADKLLKTSKNANRTEY